jgi:hypothetical protein
MASKPNVIHSRYGDKRTLLKVADDKYTLSGRSLYHRLGWLKDGTIEFMDFEGGPFVTIGSPVSLFGAKHDDRKIVHLEVKEGETPTDDITLNIKVA